MTTKAFVVAVVGAGTIAAAGAGSYLATRLGSGDVSAQPSVATVETAPTASNPITPTTVPVQTDSAATPSTSVDVERPAPAVTPKATPPQTRTRAVQDSRARDQRREPPARTSAVPPATAAPAPQPPAPAAVPPVEATAPPPPPPAAEATKPQEPAKPRFDEIVVDADSVIGIRLDQAISSETARVEDKVTARVSRDLTVDGRTAIPAGARLEGTVTAVERGGKFRERARLGIRFTSLVLGESRLRIDTDAIFRDGESPTKESTSKIGASAVVGAILGAVVGGKKGAVIGGTAGAGAGTAAVMAGAPNDVTLAAGTPLTVRLSSPVTVLIERIERN